MIRIVSRDQGDPFNFPNDARAGASPTFCSSDPMIAAELLQFCAPRPVASIALQPDSRLGAPSATALRTSFVVVVPTSVGIPARRHRPCRPDGRNAACSTARRTANPSPAMSPARLPVLVDDEVATYDSALPQTSLIATTQRIDRGWRRIGLSATQRYPGSILLAGARGAGVYRCREQLTTRTKAKH